MIGGLLMAAVLTQRAVIPGAVGPNRLDPDAAVLSVAAPLRYNVTNDGKRRTYAFTGGLEDFRLHDANGAEHPYLLIAPPTRRPQWRPAASILPIASTKTTSGFEADLGIPTGIDRIRIEGIPAPFLKRLRLEASGDREHWTVLANDATLFDLPEQQLRNLEITFEPAPFRYVRVTWDDRASARVTRVASVSAQIHDTAGPQPTVKVPVAFRNASSEPGKSRYRLTLPGAHLPVIEIELHVTNPNVYRDATITEARLSGSSAEPIPLGSSKLRRAERDDAVAEALTIPISFPQGPDLELVVDDANNPQLAIAAVNAVLAPLPWIYFESTDGRPLTATYGDETAKHPTYDLEARRNAAALSATSHATWSAPAVVARDRSLLIPVEGALANKKDFRYSRNIGSTQAGLTSLLLDPDVLARSNALRDVRILATNDRQVPYLVERRGGPVTLSLMVPPRIRGEGTFSIYRFTLPYDTLPEGTRLVLTTTNRVFERTATLWRAPDERHGRDRELLETETWRGTDPEAAAPALSFSAPLAGAREVEVDLDEGDNAPLSIATAQLQLPSYALRFISPGGPLTLVYGNASSTAPRYDLAILAPRLFGESARDISLTRAAPMIATPDSGVERRVFWIVIALAVIALLITLGRLLSSGGMAADDGRRSTD